MAYPQSAYLEVNSHPIGDYCKAHLQPGGEANKYNCVFCSSGTGMKHSGALSVNRKNNTVKCFSCNRTASLIDLVSQVEGIGNGTNEEKLEAAARAVGYDLTQSRGGAAKKTPSPTCTQKPAEQPQPDYKQARQESAAYVAAHAGNIAGAVPSGYIQQRGFTVEEAQRFGWGWDAGATAAKRADGWTPKGRLVMPYPGASWYYCARTPHQCDSMKYIKPQGVGTAPVFNPSALDHPVIVVTEGELDAFSLLAAGVENATTFGGAANAVSFIRALAARKFSGVVAVLADNDHPGRDAAKNAEAEAKAHGIPLVWLTVENAKDANEVFQRNRSELLKQVENLEKYAENEAERLRAEAWEQTRKALRLVDAAEIVEGIYSGVFCETPLPTGLPEIDEALGGGLFSGLVILGAGSSMGKTSMLCQVADNVSMSGKNVLFVTLEQSGAELAALSLRRIMAQSGTVLRPRELTSRELREEWGQDRHTLFLSACTTYSAQIAPHLHVMEAHGGTVGAAEIRAAVEALTAEAGEAPLVIIDYLQLLADDDAARDKRAAVDSNLMQLRQLARDFKTPVVVISSLSRAAYGDELGLASFKESGMVEYSSDTLLGLQPLNFKNKLVNSKGSYLQGEQRAGAAQRLVSELKKQDVRPLELVILKNRSGAMSEPVPLEFVPARAEFRGM